VIFPIFAEESNTAEYKFQYYTDDNGVNVLSNTLGAGLKLGDHAKIHADYLVDAITAASRKDHRDSPVDAVSSATLNGGEDGITSATTSEKRQEVGLSLSFCTT